MKWMRERDLLIAQTMAFVQSVTGKTPEAEKTITASVALLSVETSETIRAAAALPDIEALLAKTPPAAQALKDIPGKDAPLEHDPEKWAPVFRKDHAQIKEIERDDDSKKSHHTLGISREEMPREISRLDPLTRPDLREDFQSEIRARVANFRAHQERFNREREAYCSATMAKVHAALRESEPPTRPGK